MEFIQQFNNQNDYFHTDYSFYPGSNLKKSDFTFDDIPADDYHDLEDIRVEDLLFVDNFESSSSEAEENVHISFSDQSIKVDKYEEQLHQARIPFPAEELISSTLDTFLSLIKHLTVEQQNMCKEIRRKGRNKIHALNCRRKQKDTVKELQDKVWFAKEQLKRNEEKQSFLLQEKQYLTRKNEDRFCY
eukprot:TRINITY_DN19959_c0_g1_i1.p1 TRINITY_DN19959_c0_g1~~TRINITY_DN19959_c0_g1_i1.p1  ORF type:complete len:188 (-),score=42.56 TRINITY_DN19959_c0_g1_i1:56-619(-)